MTEATKPFQHNTIARSTSRMWKKRELNAITKQCKAGGYDVIEDKETVVVGLIDTNQIFLKALKANGFWMVRFDQKLFDENYEG